MLFGRRLGVDTRSGSSLKVASEVVMRGVRMMSAAIAVFIIVAAGIGSLLIPPHHLLEENR
jgi:hypothetical protein